MTLSIGLEIEVNEITPLRNYIDESLWSLVNEHCGYELRSKPMFGPFAIKRLLSSIRQIQMSKDEDPGFNDAGTHIHIGFMGKDQPKMPQRKGSKLGTDGEWLNPTGSGNYWYWEDKDGNNWASLDDWRASNSTTPAIMAIDTPPTILNAIKRFLALGISFSDTLIGIQHPYRRFNKYCHPIRDWDTTQLIKCKSVKEICLHPNLAANSRRLSINPLSFEKHGTIEIRMLRASLDVDEIWAQIFLFARMARLAMSLSIPLPRATGDLPVDFTILLNACKIHGRIRRYLTALFAERMAMPTDELYCSGCHKLREPDELIDIGMSRGVCGDCQHGTLRCIACHGNYNSDNMIRLDDMVEGGRWACKNCEKNGLKALLDMEEKLGTLVVPHDMKMIGNGFSAKEGIFGLSRVMATFGQFKTKKLLKKILI